MTPYEWLTVLFCALGVLVTAIGVLVALIALLLQESRHRGGKKG